LLLKFTAICEMQLLFTTTVTTNDDKILLFKFIFILFIRKIFLKAFQVNAIYYAICYAMLMYQNANLLML